MVTAASGALGRAMRASRAATAAMVFVVFMLFLQTVFPYYIRKSADGIQFAADGKEKEFVQNETF